MKSYTIHRLAQLAGVSTRTLRYYDEQGLLSSKRNPENNYRIYDQEDVDRLQQILFFKELEVPLEEIHRILNDPEFRQRLALENHLKALQEKKEQLDVLIQNVQKSLLALKGEITMKDKEKFEGFKQQLIDENEEKYGLEIREKYGDNIIDRSNATLKDMSKEQYYHLESLTEELHKTLKDAISEGNPAGPLAQKACLLHKEWLSCYWPKDTYTKEAHKGLGELYVSDKRFSDYYDNIAPGLALFLRDALRVFCK